MTQPAIPDYVDTIGPQVRVLQRKVDDIQADLAFHIGNQPGAQQQNSPHPQLEALTGYAPYAVTKVSAAYSALYTDRVILANATTVGFTVTLPPATVAGFAVIIKKTDAVAHTVTISASGSDTIEGSASVSLAAQYKSYSLIADGGTTYYIEAAT